MKALSIEMEKFFEEHAEEIANQLCKSLLPPVIKIGKDHELVSDQELLKRKRSQEDAAL